ncbi:MAG: endonuclease [Paracoccaceae bacterium]|nr:MAG: endonuclease [Paracoccaceae bacterium]
MRRIAKGMLLVLAALALVACGLHVAQSGNPALPPRPDGALRVATLNVHYILANRATGAWSLADWDRRREPLDLAFKATGADIVAFQEMESFRGGDEDSDNIARAWLLARNSGYAAAAIGDWRVFPSTQPIFYRRDRLRLMDQGWFFFSTTPDVIYSRTFNGSWPAFASWADFLPLDGGRRIRVVNVHFEHRSRSNRHLSAALVAERLAPMLTAGEPVILAGDLNDIAGTRTLAILQDAGFSFLPVQGATFHLNGGLNLLPAIDHIALAGPLRAAGAPTVLRQRFGGEWPSDHYPVVADVTLPE